MCLPFNGTQYVPLCTPLHPIPSSSYPRNHNFQASSSPRTKSWQLNHNHLQKPHLIHLNNSLLIARPPDSSFLHLKRSISTKANYTRPAKRSSIRPSYICRAQTKRGYSSQLKDSNPLRRARLSTFLFGTATVAVVGAISYGRYRHYSRRSSNMASKLVPANPSEVMVIRDVTPNVVTFSVPFLRFGRIPIGGRGTLGRYPDLRHSHPTGLN